MTDRKSACRLSYAIMTHNEIAEFTWLMETLLPLQIEDSEIVVVDDYSNSIMVQLIKDQNIKFF